ncbi:MAG: hypothetical protein QFE16_00375 [Pseudomonadota bacterium]|nr:hypothetical protein [Pseudomonadota bacterium]
MSAAKRTDPRGGHIRLHWDVIDSPAWHALSATEIAVYIAMRRQLKNEGCNGDIEGTLSTLRHFGFRSATTIAKALRGLQAVGLIAKTRDVGGLTHGGALCCLYRFTNEPAHAIAKKGVVATKATNDHLRWETTAAALSAINAAHEAAKRPDHPNVGGPQKKAKLQKLGCVAPDSGLPRSIPWTLPSAIAPDSGLCQPGEVEPEPRAGASFPADASTVDPQNRQGPETGLLYMLPSPVRSRRGSATRMGRMLWMGRLPVLSPQYIAARSRMIFNGSATPTQPVTPASFKESP